MRRKYNAELFITDYNNGMSLDELMNKYGYKNKSSIFYIIRTLKLPPRTNRWDKEKIKILEDYYPNSDWEVLLNLLSPFRKEDIIAKAYKLKIKRECYGYSVEDENYLKNNYTKMSIENLSTKLNKTPSSIMVKANKMGLVKMEKWSEEDIKKLIEMYPYNTNEELLEYFPNRTLTAISSMATMKLNLSKDEGYLQNKYKSNTKQALLKNLINFSKELGRTPTSREITENPDLGGIVTYHRYFGSYSNACIEAGLDVNANLFGKSFHLVSKNGDICLSKKEKEITDILIDNKIVYEKEVLYRDILKDETLNYIRCDWLINNEIVVEYFGMSEKDYYKIRMNDKIKLCKERGLKLISLGRKDMWANYKGLINKFNDFNIHLVV